MDDDLSRLLAGAAHLALNTQEPKIAAPAAPSLPMPCSEDNNRSGRKTPRGTVTPTDKFGPAALAPRGPPALRFGFADEISCGVSEFLRRSGIGRTHFYALINQSQIDTFLDGGKRMVLIASWAAYIARQQDAERHGRLIRRRHCIRRRGCHQQ